MAERLYHQGSRLKNLIEKSGLTVQEVVDKTPIAKSSLYDMFSKEELLMSKVRPILAVIDVAESDFIVKEEKAGYGLKDLVDSLRKENELLKQQVTTLTQQVATLQEMNEILKQEKIIYISPKKK